MDRMLFEVLKAEYAPLPTYGILRVKLSPVKMKFNLVCICWRLKCHACYDIPMSHVLLCTRLRTKQQSFCKTSTERARMALVSKNDNAKHVFTELWF